MRALDLHFFRADRQRIGAGEREPIDPGVGVEELPLARFEQAFGPERRAQDPENGGKLLRGKDIDIHLTPPWRTACRLRQPRNPAITPNAPPVSIETGPG